MRFLWLLFAFIPSLSLASKKETNNLKRNDHHRERKDGVKRDSTSITDKYLLVVEKKILPGLSFQIAQILTSSRNA